MFTLWHIARCLKTLLCSLSWIFSPCRLLWDYDSHVFTMETGELDLWECRIIIEVWLFANVLGTKPDVAIKMFHVYSLSVIHALQKWYRRFTIWFNGKCHRNLNINNGSHMLVFFVMV